MLESYRKGLLTKTGGGLTVESTGPIVLGARLETSATPSAYVAITYGKGSWILHMLRAMMGDEQFLYMLRELRRRYEWKTLSTEQFRRIASEFLPAHSADSKLETFFDQWVYGTGIPVLKLSYSVSGRAPKLQLNGVVTQTDVDSEFNTLAPVEIVYGEKRLVQWVRTLGSAGPFTVTLPQAPTRVSLDTTNVLAVYK